MIPEHGQHERGQHEPVPETTGRWFTTRDGRRHRIDRPDVGLLAGWGEFPLAVADALRRQGFRVHCVAVADHADPALAARCDSFRWCGLAQYGRMLSHFRRQGCGSAVMAGKIFKIRWLHPAGFFHFLPDFGALIRLPRLWRRRDGRDDTILSIVVDQFADDGVQFLPATDFAPELLVKPGQLTRRGLSAAEQADVAFGWQMAKEMGRLDVGQSVAIKGRTVLAVEAIEGTDECIRRAGMLAQGGGFTVVKVAKPQQDMRFDVPTVGIKTLETMLAAGGRVLAIEADRTIVLDERTFIRYADEHRLAVVALVADAAGLPIAAA